MSPSRLRGRSVSLGCNDNEQRGWISSLPTHKRLSIRETQLLHSCSRRTALSQFLSSSCDHVSGSLLGSVVAVHTREFIARSIGVGILAMVDSALLVMSYLNANTLGRSIRQRASAAEAIHVAQHTQGDNGGDEIPSGFRGCAWVPWTQRPRCCARPHLDSTIERFDVVFTCELWRCSMLSCRDQVAVSTFSLRLQKPRAPGKRDIYYDIRLYYAEYLCVHSSFVTVPEAAFA
nr:hypothetical protein CFP56_04383 [Quercus suber]